MYKIVFFVPRSHAEAVKQALFAAGAGRFAGYEHCSFETEGTGQFRPLTGSTPFIGEENRLERVPELRVEMICPDAALRDAMDALVSAHPYEEVACEAYRIETPETLRRER